MAQSTHTTRPPLERSRDAGDVKTLQAAFQHSVDNRDSNYWERQRINHETRYCIWANQYSDGRKWKRSDNKRVFPWLGASDARVPLVDKYVREDVALLVDAWAKNRIQVWPNDPAHDMGWSRNMTSLLRWLVYEEMDESEEEAEYLANLLLENGAAALGVWWYRQETRTRAKITMAELEAAAQQAAARIAQGEQDNMLLLQASMPGMIADPSREEELLPLVQAVASDGAGFTKAQARKALRNLRENGEAFYPVTTVMVDRPKVRAMCLNEDLWLPPDVTDISTCREAFVLEKLTESQLAARVHENDYDEDWVDWVIETQRGKATDNAATARKYRNDSTMGSLLEPADSQLYDVVTAYERRHDEDGVVGIHVTVFSPSQKEDQDPAHSERLDYAHGQMPMVIFQRERRSRRTDDSRGYGEVANVFQGQIKRQWDLQIDRADVSTLPPGHHPPGEEPAMWGPGINIATMQPDNFGYFDIPKPDATADKVLSNVRDFADEYFGRPIPERDPIGPQLIRSELVRGWMLGWKKAHTQILQLCQQFMPDEFYYRVVGSQGPGIRATRDDIQGPFTVSLRFSTADLDQELVAQKLELLKIATDMDATGRVDRDELLEVVLELLDPGYVDRLLKPGEQASMEQIEDEQEVLTKLLSGIAVDVRGDEAFMLRMQTLQQLIQSNPEAQEKMAKSEHVRGLVERRMQQLDFNVQQKMVNPEIGRRLGTQPNPQLGVQGNA